MDATKSPTLTGTSTSSTLVEVTKSDKVSTKTIAFALIASSIALIGLVFAQVKYGIFNHGLSIMAANPATAGFILGFLAGGAALYLITRFMKPSEKAPAQDAQKTATVAQDNQPGAPEADKTQTGEKSREIDLSKTNVVTQDNPLPTSEADKTQTEDKSRELDLSKTNVVTQDNQAATSEADKKQPEEKTQEIDLSKANAVTTEDPIQSKLAELTKARDESQAALEEAKQKDKEAAAQAYHAKQTALHGSSTSVDSDGTTNSLGGSFTIVDVDLGPVVDQQTLTTEAVDTAQEKFDAAEAALNEFKKQNNLT